MGKGRFDVTGDAIGNDGMVLDVRVEGSLSDIGTEDRSVGSSDCDELLDKGDDHGESVLSERLLSNDAKDETWLWVQEWSESSVLSQQSGEKVDVCESELGCWDVLRPGNMFSLNKTCLEV